MRPYFPGGTFNALAPARRGSSPPIPNVHRLLPGLPGYLILFAPPAFVHQCQELSRVSFRHECSSRYLRISLLHREFQTPLQSSSEGVSDAVPRLSPGLSHLTFLTPTHPLRPVIPNNAWDLRITAAAGTKLAVPSSSITVTPAGYSPAEAYSLMTGVYNPKTFILHAASQHQGFPHCA